MEYKEILNSLKDEYVHKYVVRFKDGSKKTLKLWNNGGVAVMDKGKRRKGHFLHSIADNYANWESITLYENSCDIFKRVIKRAKKAFEMLSESGLWTEHKIILERFLHMSGEDQKEIVNKLCDDSYAFYLLCTDGKSDYSWIGSCYHLFEQFAKEKCWKSINWMEGLRETYTEYLKNCIEHKEHYSHKWYKGYDNSIEVNLCTDGILRGWYSEEYKGCGNGHYYMLLDATHAIHIEDD